MTGTILNEKSFLTNIAKSLGREPRLEGVSLPSWKHAPQHEVLKDATLDELTAELKEMCKRINTEFCLTDSANASGVVKEIMEGLGNGPVIIPNDSRFSDLGLMEVLEEAGVHVWNPSLGRKNIELADQANIGITFSEITLAESGTVVLFSGQNHGRSISFLPTCHVSIIPKSSLVPRMTQASAILRSKVKQGELVPSCINFITGPSNSADIEMDLVVGVHGPTKAVYIVIEDL